MTEINSMREEVGLRKIDSSFNLSKYTMNSKSTFDRINHTYNSVQLSLEDGAQDNGKLKNPHYWQKFIYLDSKTGELKHESDTYRSGKNIMGTDEIIYESIILKYIYNQYNVNNGKNSSDKNNSRGWHYIYLYADTLNTITSSNRPNSKTILYNEVQKEVSKAYADSILKSWKLLKPY